MSQASKTKMKKPNAMFEFVVNGEEGETDEEKQQKKIRMEFSHEELFEFYNKVSYIYSRKGSLPKLTLIKPQ